MYMKLKKYLTDIKTQYNKFIQTEDAKAIALNIILFMPYILPSILICLVFYLHS